MSKIENKTVYRREWLKFHIQVSSIDRHFHFMLTFVFNILYIINVSDIEMKKKNVNLLTMKSE